MSENTKRVGILGYGEVGKAIASFYETPAIKDIDRNEFPLAFPFDVLHVCIPWSKDFIEVVAKTILEFAPEGLVIIHSTVPVGTTKYVAKTSLNEFVVHSPVRGVHPNLAEGIKTFPKYIGADNPGAGRLAAEHLMGLGVEPVVLYKSATSELLKLLDTTYYGLAIAFHDYAAKLCERENVNFDMVMTEANRSYNEGYAKLGKPNVIRPVLQPPENSRIGGHCVVPNAQILRAQFGKDHLLEAIIRHK